MAIVTDIRLYRDGLVRHLEGQPSLEVVGTAASAGEAIDLVAELAPDLVLIEFTLRDCRHAIREFVAQVPAPRVVVLDLPHDESEFLAFAEAGVAGFIPREASLAELVATLECAARGEVLISPRATGALLRRVLVLATGLDSSADTLSLTAREAEVVGLIDDGRSNKEIARGLGIEVATVKNHVHHILQKLGLTRRGEVSRRIRSRRLRVPTSMEG